jgi:ribose 5-phosphate isomerase B
MWNKENILALASDHAGFPLKRFLIAKLLDEQYKIHDFGTDSLESTDYPDFAHQIGAAINNGEFVFGIVMCGSGNGVNMVVNKYPKVRGALCWNSEQAQLTRQHNDANVLSLPGRFIDFDEAWKAVELFVNTEFEGGRHQRRVDKVSQCII